MSEQVLVYVRDFREGGWCRQHHAALWLISNKAEEANTAQVLAVYLAITWIASEQISASRANAPTPDLVKRTKISRSSVFSCLKVLADELHLIRRVKTETPYGQTGVSAIDLVYPKGLLADSRSIEWTGEQSGGSTQWTGEQSGGSTQRTPPTIPQKSEIKQKSNTPSGLPVGGVHTVDSLHTVQDVVLDRGAEGKGRGKASLPRGDVKIVKRPGPLEVEDLICRYYEIFDFRHPGSLRLTAKEGLDLARVWENKNGVPYKSRPDFNIESYMRGEYGNL